MGFWGAVSLLLLVGEASSNVLPILLLVAVPEVGGDAEELTWHFATHLLYGSFVVFDEDGK